MSEGKLIAINKLGFKVDGDYNHYGVFQARELTYQGRYNFSDFINYGRVISTSQAFIRGYFQNTSRGNADLTGATFDTVNWRAKSLVNEGILRLANLQSLGRDEGRAAEGR